MDATRGSPGSPCLPGPACAPSAQPATARRRGAPSADPALVASLCKALAHPARVQLLQYLARQGTCYFGNLSEIVGLAPSTTSEHVKILKEAGLVLGSAEEQRTCYCVNPARLALLKRLVSEL